jgi:predicted dehydrogenase
MVIRIGWLDHHLHTHHSQVFVPLLRDKIGKGDFEIVAAYESTRDPDKSDWCAQNGVKRASSPEEVIAASDVLMVVSPNNPEAHLELSRAALESGKPVYIDKYLSHTVEDAREIVKLAKQHKSPLFTSSSLPFAKEVTAMLAEAPGPIEGVFARGHGPWRMYYGVHTIALAVRGFGAGAKRLIDTGTKDARFVTLDDGSRKATIEVRVAENQAETSPWELGVLCRNKQYRAIVQDYDAFYENLVAQVCSFFKTRTSPLSLEEQFATVAIEVAAEKSQELGGVWVDIETP